MRSGALEEPLAREGVGQHAQLDPASMQLSPQLGGRRQEPHRRDVERARGIEDDVHLPSEAIRGHQRSSEVFRGTQRPSEANRGADDVYLLVALRARCERRVDDAKVERQAG